MATKKNVGYASYRLKPLQIITAEAKKIQAGNKNISWQDAIKKASAKYRSGSASAAPAKKAAPKKAAPVKREARKKAAPKKAARPVQAKLFGAKKAAGIQTKSRKHTDYNKPTVNIQIGNVSEERKSFWLKCFAPRTRKWQNATYAEIKRQLQNGLKNPFDSEQSLMEQLRALEYILNKKPYIKK